MTNRCQQILVVDRDPDFQIGLADALGHEGVTVLSVNCCALALQAVEGGFCPDAILVDFVAEDAGSAEFLRRVKANYAVPIIAISPGPTQWRIGPTVDRELHEPFDARELLAVLDELCTSPRSPAGRGR